MKEKRYKTISEVSEILNIGTHIIRYWDSKLSISNQSLNKTSDREAIVSISRKF